MSEIETDEATSTTTPTSGDFHARLSDDDRSLLQRNFWISDPESLPGLLPRVPAKDEIPEIEYRYDLTPPVGKTREYVRCAHCFRPIHWRGNVGRYADGSRILLGCDCGEKQFGFMWAGREEFFSDRMSRHDLLVRLEGLEAALPLISSFLATLHEHASLEEFIRLRHELGTKMPELIAILTKALHATGGTLTVTEKVRDVPAELARDDRQKYSKNPETKPIFKTIMKSLGQIAGGPFLLNGGTPKAEIRKLAESCELLQHRFSTVGSDGVPAAAALLEEAQSIVEATDAMMQRLHSANRFLDLANLQSITLWMRKRLQITNYTVSQTALSRLGATDTVRFERRLIVPPTWSSRQRIGDLLAV